jgi:hypothetical protein
MRSEVSGTPVPFSAARAKPGPDPPVPRDTPDDEAQWSREEQQVSSLST